MGKHKQVSCGICLRIMRSDVVKRHMKQHVKRNEILPTTKRKYDDDEEYQPMIKKKCNVLDDEELERDIIKDNEEYNCKLALGEKVYKIVERRKVKKESLSLERKEAFELYRRNVKQLDEKELEYENNEDSENDKEYENDEDSENDKEYENEMEKVIKEEMDEEESENEIDVEKEKVIKKEMNVEDGKNNEENDISNNVNGNFIILN